MLSDLKIVEMETWPGEAGEGDGCEAGSLGNNINPGRGERKVLGTHSGQGPGCHVIQVREQQPVIQSKWLNKIYSNFI